MREMLRDAYNVKTAIAMGGGMPDYMLVQCTLKIVGGCLKKWVVDNT